jgi:uncharacterized membrane protein
MTRLILKAKESLYGIPVAIVVGCAGLAFLALYLDSNVSDWPLMLETTVTGGRAIATTVAGATITVAAIVFSITALSTQMASNQYSPRALGEFFDDPFQQTIIGLVVGTFTYSLLVLASLGSAIADGSGPSPSLAVTLSLSLGVISAIGIVGYINHSLRRMQIDSVVRRIATASISAIERHLERRTNADAAAEGPPPQGDSRVVKAKDAGWVVSIDAKAALRALPSGGTGRVDVRLGEAVSPGDRIITLWPDPGEDWEGTSSLRRSVVTAHERSIDLDPTFGIRQLVDIALRALSPGVNDPTTAVDVIHHLKTPIRTVLLSEAPQRVFSGPEDKRVFLSKTPSRSDYVYQAFSEIRLAAGGQPYVISALLEVLSDLKADLEDADLSERQIAVHHELESTIAMAQASGLPEADLKRVIDRSSVRAEFDEPQSSG